jgi:hypothetical protein
MATWYRNKNWIVLVFEPQLLGRMSWEYFKFEASLGYIVRLPSSLKEKERGEKERLNMNKEKGTSHMW